ncbi:MAG: LD-carboxypeptidase [Ruminococcus sp.]|nr:LD-carboxypeptidase [Ruminococcus sp.]
MIYPDFIKEHDTIGVTAPSDGITDKAKLKRLDFAIVNFQKLGFKIKETTNVRTSIKGKSSPSNIQAKELISLYLDCEVKMIWCAAGGDFLLQMLSYIDWNILKNNPKWLQGYSDPTGLLFTITTNFDIATIYGDNFAQFGMNPWHKSLENNLEILKGNIIAQESFSKCESGYTKYIKGDEPFNLDATVKWETLNNAKEVLIKGRIIGGCIDILSELFGTKYDKTLDFTDRYKNDGIVWYFDNCELTSEALIRTLWRFKEKGWFKYSTGIIFGRSATNSSYYDISFKEAISEVLNDLNIPIIINADIGHVSPRMTIINGALTTIKFNQAKSSITFELK